MSVLSALFLEGIMRRKLKSMAIAAVAAIACLNPVMAELEGPLRDQMEFLDFSETMIRDGLYAKTGHDVFNKNKRAFIRGVKDHNAPRIYEPDVYTWELAMAEHRKKLDQLAPPAAPEISTVAPTPMLPPSLMPASPAPLQLTPIGPQAVIEQVQPLPADAQMRMNQMVYRARQRGIYPQRDLRAEEIKQKLLTHMNSLGQGASIPALMPALPPGSRGDSFDAGF